LVLVWAEATAANPADPDLWHRLAVGEFLRQTGHFPAGDTFSYLADFRRIADHEWGGALIFYAAWTWAGGGAIVALKIVTLAVTMAFLVFAGGQDRQALLAAFYAVVLLALLPSFQSTLRCMAFTNLIFALWLYWFQLERRGRLVPVWAYVVTMILWANLHGGFVVGLLWLLGVTLVRWAQGEGDEAKKWAARLALCGAATLINPFGAQLGVSTIRALFTTRRGFDEWAPVSWWPDDYPGYKLLLFGTVLLLGAIIWRRGWKKLDRSALVLVAGTLAISLVSARHTSLFALVAGALLPGLFPAGPRFDRHFERLGFFALRAALVLIPLLLALSLLPGDGFRLRYPDTSCPVRAVDFLQRENVRGNLLVPFNYGSYALWRLRGRMRVSMDGRYELVYRPETYRRIDDFFFARGDWPDLLRSPAPAAVLLPVADPVYPKLKTEPGWREAYRDATDAVFLSTAPSFP